jgi:hypothetical protein
MTRETLIEILSDLGQAGEGVVHIRKGQDVSVHVGPPGEGLEIGLVESVELRKSHVRVTSTKGQMFLFPFEDLSLVVTSAKEKRAGFGSA